MKHIELTNGILTIKEATHPIHIHICSLSSTATSSLSIKTLIVEPLPSGIEQHSEYDELIDSQLLVEPKAQREMIADFSLIVEILCME